VPILCLLIQLYILVLVARAISTWFPVRADSGMGQIVGVLVTVTEPVLGPARRIIPPLGMIDISFIVVIIALQLFRGVICT
jgi:YggT family protein